MGVVGAIIKFVQSSMAESQIKTLIDAAPQQIVDIKEHFSWFIPSGSTQQVLDAASNQMVEKTIYWHSVAGGEWLSFAAYGALIGFFIWYILKRKK
jgi:hypothetical protein